MNREPLTPEEEAAIRERHAKCSRPMSWHIDVHRLLATLDAAREPNVELIRYALHEQGIGCKPTVAACRATHLGDADRIVASIAAATRAAA